MHDTILSCSYKGNTFFYPEASDIGKLLASGQAWDGNIAIILRRIFEQDDIIAIEVGTNIGASLMQMKLAKPAASIHCFEPSDRYFGILQRNVAENKWQHVYLNKVGLSNEPGQDELYNNATTASIVAQDYDGHTFISHQTIKLTTIDEYWPKHQKLDFIKLDTDGYDFTILQGAKRTLADAQPLIYFEFQASQLQYNHQRPEDFIAFLIDLGYSTFLMFDNFGTPVGMAANTAEIMQAYGSVRFMDILAVHKTNTAQAHKVSELYQAFLSGTIMPVTRGPIARAQKQPK